MKNFMSTWTRFSTVTELFAEERI